MVATSSFDGRRLRTSGYRAITFTSARHASVLSAAATAAGPIPEQTSTAHHPETQSPNASVARGYRVHPLAGNKCKHRRPTSPDRHRQSRRSPANRCHRPASPAHVKMRSTSSLRPALAFMRSGATMSRATSAIHVTDLNQPAFFVRVALPRTVRLSGVIPSKMASTRMPSRSFAFCEADLMWSFTNSSPCSSTARTSAMRP